MNQDDLLRLIFRLQRCLLNHPPVPALFEERTLVLSQAEALIRDMEEEPYELPQRED
jgi:hypothetical protein